MEEENDCFVPATAKIFARKTWQIRWLKKSTHLCADAVLLLLSCLQFQCLVRGVIVILTLLHDSLDVLPCFLTDFFVILVRPSLEPGWLEGFLDGRRGLVPENYVEFLG